MISPRSPTSTTLSSPRKTATLDPHAVEGLRLPMPNPKAIQNGGRTLGHNDVNDKVSWFQKTKNRLIRSCCVQKKRSAPLGDEEEHMLPVKGCDEHYLPPSQRHKYYIQELTTTTDCTPEGHPTAKTRGVYMDNSPEQYPASYLGQGITTTTLSSASQGMSASPLSPHL